MCLRETTLYVELIFHIRICEVSGLWRRRGVCVGANLFAVCCTPGMCTTLATHHAMLLTMCVAAAAGMGMNTHTDVPFEQ